MKALADLGWDVVTVEEWSPAAETSTSPRRPGGDGRVLLTFDKDFGEICRKSPLIAPDGVVLFRLSNLSAAETISRILDALKSRKDWRGAFWVVEAERIRSRRSAAPG